MNSTPASTSRRRSSPTSTSVGLGISQCMEGSGGAHGSAEPVQWRKRKGPMYEGAVHFARCLLQEVVHFRRFTWLVGHDGRLPRTAPSRHRSWRNDNRMRGAEMGRFWAGVASGCDKSKTMKGPENSSAPRRTQCRCQRQCLLRADHAGSGPARRFFKRRTTCATRAACATRTAGAA